MLVKSSTPLFSLKKTAQALQNASEYTSCTMGILIDATRSVYRDIDKDYVTELKIIDETLNEQEVYGVMVKWCTVYVFSTVDLATFFCNKIGQIIYLDKFIFSVWHNIKMQTKYLSRTESLYCFESNGEKLIQMGCIKSQGAQQLNELVQPRGLKLYQWFLSFFYSQYKPSLGVTLLNNYTLLAESFNFILKRTEVENSEIYLIKSEDNDQIFKFMDANGNCFYIKAQSLCSPLPTSQYLLFRGVNRIGHFYEIIMSETANILGLPQGFEQAYQRVMNYCAVHRLKERFLLKNDKVCPLSRLTSQALKTTPISQLMEQAELYDNHPSGREDLRPLQTYMIEAVGITFRGNLHMFHTEHQIIVDHNYLNSLSEQERRQLIDEKKIYYLYEGIMGVIDRSSQSANKIFNVHLFSNEKRAQFYESSLVDNLIMKADRDFTKVLQQAVKKKIEQKLHNVIKKSTFTNSIMMLIEPIKTDTLIYRLTNTIFE